MNPNPFPALNHFTVPVSFMFLLPNDQVLTYKFWMAQRIRRLLTDTFRLNQTTAVILKSIQSSTESCKRATRVIKRLTPLAGGGQQRQRGAHPLRFLLKKARVRCQASSAAALS